MAKHRIRVSAKDYYDVLPVGQHSPGDIWTDVPTLGLLRADFAPALVITPACDLANQKVETVTYLPIMSVSSYLSSPGFWPEIQREFRSVVSQLGVDGVLDHERFAMPTSEDLDAFETLLRTSKGSLKSQKDKDLFTRAVAGVEALRAAAATGVSNVAPVRGLFGTKNMVSLLDRIVRNSYRPDVHFLPADEQPSEWAAVSEHSIVLFRYTLSAPLVLFELAQDTAIKDWTAVASKLIPRWPIASAFSTRRPIKRLSLKPRFLSDLLTRYVSMYVRLGSPDFTPETVAEYVREIGEL